MQHIAAVVGNIKDLQEEMSTLFDANAHLALLAVPRQAKRLDPEVRENIVELGTYFFLLAFSGIFNYLPIF